MLEADVFSLTYTPSKNLRISLFLTVVDCWIRAADLETSSISFPWRMNSSFWAFEASHVTPGSMFTIRVNFSPKKLRTSTLVLASEMAMLMGKWAYTDLILYL